MSQENLYDYSLNLWKDFSEKYEESVMVSFREISGDMLDRVTSIYGIGCQENSQDRYGLSRGNLSLVLGDGRASFQWSIRSQVELRYTNTWINFDLKRQCDCCSPCGSPSFSLLRDIYLSIPLSQFLSLELKKAIPISF